MTVKISAVVDGKTYSVVLEGEDGAIVTQQKMAIVTILMNQAAWLTNLEVNEG